MWAEADDHVVETMTKLVVTHRLQGRSVPLKVAAHVQACPKGQRSMSWRPRWERRAAFLSRCSFPGNISLPCCVPSCKTDPYS